MTVQDHRGLIVWQRTMELVVECYRLAARLPAFELNGLASQMRRAAVSASANIAEGNGRLYRGEYLRHLSISRGSLQELHTPMEVGERLGYFTSAELAAARDFTDQSLRMLTTLRRKLKS